MFCSIKSNPSTISNTILGSGKFGFVIKAETETGHFKAIKNLYIYDEVANSNIDIISKICDDHTTLSTHKHDNIYEILKIETGEVKASHLKKLRKLVPSSECSEHGKKMLELVKILLSRIKNTQVINLQIHMKFYNTSLRIFLDMEPNTERNEYSEYKVVQDILDGLIFLHENFIYHGDIRPENIFILIPSIQSGKNAPVAIISDVGLSSSFMCNAQCLSTQAKLKKYPARGLEENKPRVDIFYTGCVALEVFQIVEQFSQNSLINKILYQDGTELIKTHGLVKNSKELIETFLCSTIVSDISSIKLELSASLVATSLELSDRLRKCDEGDIILLQPGQYVGPFYLDKKNIKLFAANCYVSLKPKDDSYDPIVHITSDGVSLEGIKLDMKDRPNSTGIMVNGDSVKIKDLNSYGGFNSVLLCAMLSSTTVTMGSTNTTWTKEEVSQISLFWPTKEGSRVKDAIEGKLVNAMNQTHGVLSIYQQLLAELDIPIDKRTELERKYHQCPQIVGTYSLLKDLVEAVCGCKGKICTIGMFLDAIDKTGWINASDTIVAANWAEIDGLDRPVVLR
ncbi:uncharacterized protein LOC118433663 isoform X2 [Folsomia candida]|uniref:uncharacterized protein LOC118433663 isoform X2 n=1 Tax=Folsomia candida TaxID=158441 RepID=UPI0016051318|nr:uncharacterized protein LOC118433663 isoform X2 [Folsomia candida]